MTRYRNLAFKNQPQIHLRTIQNYPQANNKLKELEKNAVKSLQVSEKNPPISNYQVQANKQLIFLKMSSIHQKFRLKYQTLFLAFEIYLKYMNCRQTRQSQRIAENELLIVCMYLSMKYEEIYPPRLKHLLGTKNLSAEDLKRYIKLQKQVLISINANLGLSTAKDRMDELLNNVDDAVYHHAFYFLQIAYSQPTINSRFSIDVICKSIVFLVTAWNQSGKKTRQFMDIKMGIITACSKLLIKSHNYQMQSLSAIFNKYRSERYFNVAVKPLPNSA